jgi:hypothetical protein
MCRKAFLALLLVCLGAAPALAVVLSGSLPSGTPGTVTSITPVVTGGGGGGSGTVNPGGPATLSYYATSGTTLSDSGIGITTLCRTTGVCTGYQAALGYTPVPDTRALTFTGTAGEVTLSAGAQTLAADRTWNVSLATALNLASKTVTLPNSTTLPATCGVGQIYFDTDATAGQNFFGCTATNTWTLQAGLGDVTAVGTCTSGACFTDATPSTRLTFTTLAAPATPAAGVGTVYVDSTSKNLCVTDDAGLVKCGVQAKAAVASQWLRSIGADGTVGASQPAFADIANVATNAQLPGTISGKRIDPRAVQLTDAATVTINSDTTDVGYLLTLSQTTNFAVPSGTPVAGQLLRVWILSASAQTLTWSTGTGGFSANMGLPMPIITTGGGAYDMFGFEWNQNSSRWDVVATTQSSLSARRRTCVIRVGADSESAVLVNAQLGPELHACLVPTAATVEEITVQADAGTPNVIVHRRTATTNTALLSSALATAASGATACARPTAIVGFTPSVTCSATLQNVTVAGGDTFGLTSGTAGGTAKRMTITITYLLTS